eukprot:g30742.t1
MRDLIFSEPLYAAPGMGQRINNFSRMFAGHTPANTSFRKISSFLSTASSQEEQTREGDKPQQGPTLEKQQEDAFTTALLTAALWAVTASFQHGFNSTLLNVPEHQVRSALFLNDIQWGLVVSIFCLGGLTGSYIACMIADRFGRKNCIAFVNIFFVVGSYLQATSRTYQQLAIGRFISGMGCGCSTVVVPLYLGEIAPASLRGRLGRVFTHHSEDGNHECSTKIAKEISDN